MLARLTYTAQIISDIKLQCIATVAVILIHFCLLHSSSFKKFLEYEKCKAPTDEKQTKLPIMRSKYSSSHHRRKALVKSISLALVVDCGVPVSIVEKQAFTRFLSVADESFNSVNR